MYDGIPLARQIISDIIHHFVVSFMGATESFAGFLVLDCSLLSLDTAPGIAVAAIEATLSAIVLEANLVRV